MRVRLYEVGLNSQASIYRIDEFPANLCLDEAGNLSIRRPDRLPVCQLEDVGGEIFLRASEDAEQVRINDAEIVSGPLMPGDQLRLGERKFLVSYEKTFCEHNQSMRVRIPY